MPENKKAIELKGITKTFGSVIANDNVDFEVSSGEILALLGENGSGKTTLMNVLSGIYKPDSGQVYVNGEEVVIQSPEDSKRLGIGMVHQHFKLVDNFTAADNIWIGADADTPFLTNERYDHIKEIGDKYGFEIDLKKKIYDMAVSEKQTVEILKVLFYGAEILILDEPTAVLTLQETNKLFSVIRNMKKQGAAIIIITHKLNEVLEISDKVTILRKGCSVGTVKTSETNAQQLTDLMVGHSVKLEIDCPKCDNNEVLLALDNVTVLNDEGVNAVTGVSFEVKSGEILGVAGVSGCGQKELCEAIAGLLKLKTGSIVFKGEHIEGKTPREIIEHGISMSFIPEDRLGMGLAPSLSITDNMMLKNYIDNPGIFVDRKAARKKAQQIINELAVVTPGTEYPVRRLSGGNVQKVLLGREIESNPTLLVTAYPVRGLDINSSYTIYDILNKQKIGGGGVLFVGEDLDVMLELCDRILVLSHGVVTGIVQAKDTNKEELGLLMTDAYGVESKSNDTISEETGHSEPQTEEPKKYEPTYIFESNQNKKTKKITHHKPFFRIVKRDELPWKKSLLYYAMAILTAIIVGGLFITLSGINPIDYYNIVMTGCFSNQIYLRGFISIVIPLLITSLGISVAFKMKFWNIGANGQFIMGAVFATTTAFLLGNSLPSWLTLIIVFIAGALGGALFGFIPALFKVKFGTNETLMTLMLNYIAFYIVSYLKNVRFFRKVSATGELLRPDFKVLPESSWLNQITIGQMKIDISIIFAVLLVVLVFIYYKSTKQGYEISVVGDSPNTAKYAGMNVNRIVIRTMIISSAIIGAAGMFQVTGSSTGHTLAEGITSDVGWTGITVAWLSKLNPFGILVTSVLMAILTKGSSVAESKLSVSASTSSILQGLILFTVLAADFFVRYKIVLNVKQKESRGVK